MWATQELVSGLKLLLVHRTLGGEAPTTRAGQYFLCNCWSSENVPGLAQGHIVNLWQRRGWPWLQGQLLKVTTNYVTMPSIVKTCFITLKIKSSTGIRGVTRKCQQWKKALHVYCLSSCVEFIDYLRDAHYQRCLLLSFWLLLEVGAIIITPILQMRKLRQSLGDWPRVSQPGSIKDWI